MAQASGVLSKSEKDRIYEMIRRDALDGIAPSQDGQPSLWLVSPERGVRTPQNR